MGIKINNGNSFFEKCCDDFDEIQVIYGGHLPEQNYMYGVFANITYGLYGSKYFTQCKHILACIMGTNTVHPAEIDFVSKVT
jgi:hypothetical protein